MLDREGFRPQGGIKYGETPEQAMYRELHEEIGLLPEHVRIVGRTRDWLRYEVPDKFIRREIRGHYRGQKQIWFLLRMAGRDCDIHLRATDHPEFDAWRWSHYWVPLEAVIEFKRDVYQMALTELSRFLNRNSRAPLSPYGTHGAHGRYGGAHRAGQPQRGVPQEPAAVSAADGIEVSPATPASTPRSTDD